MHTTINKLIFLFLTFLVTGCVTSPVKQGAFQKGQWETKAQINDLKENKKQNLSIDIYAIKNERARIEISALLGFQVASLVMSPSEISYAIYPQKTFYYGRNSERAFRRMVDLPLHPMNLINIAFDEPIRGPGWRCELGNDGFIAACENSQRQLKAVWSDRKDGQKKVILSGPQFEMTWFFYPPKTEVQFKSDLFTLKQPEGFKAIQLN